MKLLRLHFLGLVLLASGLTMDTGSACCHGGTPRPPTVRPPTVNVRPPTLPSVTVPRDGVQTGGGNTRGNTADGNRGGKSGKTACKNCGCPDCPSDGGVPASQTARTAVQTQQAVVDKAYQDFKAADAFRDEDLRRWEAALGVEALRDSFFLGAEQSDNAKKNADKLKQKYLDDPTAENDRLAKEAEQAFFGLEKEAAVRELKWHEAHKRVNRENDPARIRRNDAYDKFRKEVDKLHQLKTKLAQVVGAELLDSLPD